MSMLDWASSDFTKPGESVSGDAGLVRFFPPAGALLAVMDGLGHGPEAADAARRAREVLETCAPSSVIDLTRRCHQMLAGSRGVCLSLATFNAQDHTMTWMGVGNVEAVLVRAHDAEREHMLLRSGVVGLTLPRLQATMMPIHAGDMLVMYTDGIRMPYGDPLPAPDSPPGVMAQALLRRYLSSKPADDALVIVARYTGGSLGQ